MLTLIRYCSSRPAQAGAVGIERGEIVGGVQTVPLKQRNEAYLGKVLTCSQCTALRSARRAT